MVVAFHFWGQLSGWHLTVVPSDWFFEYWKSFSWLKLGKFVEAYFYLGVNLFVITSGFGLFLSRGERLVPPWYPPSELLFSKKGVRSSGLQEFGAHETQTPEGTPRRTPFFENASFNLNTKFDFKDFFKKRILRLLPPAVLGMVFLFLVKGFLLHHWPTEHLIWNLFPFLAGLNLFSDQWFQSRAVH